MSQSSRTLIACEYCRRSKRKCAPPYPCYQCTKANVDCVVRDIARPQKSARFAPAAQQDSVDTVQSTDWSRKSSMVSGSSQSATSSATSIHGSSQSPGLPAPDACDLVRGLVINETRNGSDLSEVCDLTEPGPRSIVTVANAGSEFTLRISSAISKIHVEEMEGMIDWACNNFLTITGVLNPVLLRMVKNLATEFLMYSPSALTLGEANLYPRGMSLDRAGLLFATLALASYTNADQAIFQSLLELSTWMTEHYTCEPTLDLVLVLVVQYECALCADTTEAAQKLVKRAIDIAHELGLHIPKANADVQSLRLYMTLCMADEYCAISNNNIPYITAIAPDLFKPLIEEIPRLRSLIGLVALNGLVLQKLHAAPGTIESTTHLESASSKVFSSIAKLRPEEWKDTTHVEDHFEILLQVHVFWSRIMLRAPWIQPVPYRATSLAICARAAHMLLSIYFCVVSPSIRAIVSTHRPTPDGPTARKLQSIAMLPPTWPQVRRIVTSAFLFLYAYWKGEAAYDECARSCATALLVLEFSRTRFGAKIDAPASSIKKLAKASRVTIRPFLSQQVPNIDTSFLDVICGEAETAIPAEDDADSSSALESLQEWSMDHPSQSPAVERERDVFWEIPLYADVMRD